MYYGLGTGGHCCIGAGQTLCVDSRGGSTFLLEMTSSKNDVIGRLRQSMHIYLNNPAKVHPDLI